MSISIRKATITDLAAFSMLWQFYQYHQSSFEHEDVDENGRFDIDEEYLEDVLNGKEECDAYLVLSDGCIAGFSTVEPTEIAGKEIPELSDIFILPKYRNSGVAKLVVEKLMLSQPGEWHVAVYKKDAQALSYWESLFSRLEIQQATKLNPPETADFHEFIVKNA
ncbi:GNAT family N-acetyltransferase [Vibrio campbellii]|uniref:GNAT family N-acetyltransferase n=1 Tax=Vibrio campbellii TaxID=680 RepID=A0AAQ2XZK9_9VIBR|nr:MULTISPECIES: GNAT family N-acetyltransferase [Gammaproteobacteria]WDG08983.1 GNAT family N-acetyltransferase [Vibrio campbellii]